MRLGGFPPKNSLYCLKRGSQNIKNIGLIVATKGRFRDKRDGSEACTCFLAYFQNSKFEGKIGYFFGIYIPHRNMV